MDKGLGYMILGNIALFVLALGAIYFDLTFFGIVLFVLGVVTMPQLHAMLNKTDSDVDKAERILDKLKELSDEGDVAVECYQIPKKDEEDNEQS